MKTFNLIGLGLPQHASDFRLRYWEPKDRICVRSASEDSYIPMITSIPAHCGDFLAEDWIHRQNKKISEGTDLPLCIALNATDEAVGMMGVFGLDELGKKNASCGYWISPIKRGTKISGRALKMLTNWALDVLSLSLLELFIEPGNVASIRTAESAGFKYSKTLPAYQKIGGQMRDMLLYTSQKSPSSGSIS